MGDEIYIYHYNYLSNWLLVLFILYYVGISPFNPILLIIVGIIVMMILTIRVYEKDKNINDIIGFGWSTIFNKLIPAVLLIGSPIYYKDIVFNVVVVIIYQIYMTYYNKIGIVQFYINLPYQYFIYSKRERATTIVF